MAKVMATQAYVDQFFPLPAGGGGFVDQPNGTVIDVASAGTTLVPVENNAITRINFASTAFDGSPSILSIANMSLATGGKAAIRYLHLTVPAMQTDSVIRVQKQNGTQLLRWETPYPSTPHELTIALYYDGTSTAPIDAKILTGDDVIIPPTPGSGDGFITQDSYTIALGGSTVGVDLSDKAIVSVVAPDNMGVIDTVQLIIQDQPDKDQAVRYLYLKIPPTVTITGVEIYNSNGDKLFSKTSGFTAGTQYEYLWGIYWDGIELYPRAAEVKYPAQTVTPPTPGTGGGFTDQTVPANVQFNTSDIAISVEDNALTRLVAPDTVANYGVAQVKIKDLASNQAAIRYLYIHVPDEVTITELRILREDGQQLYSQPNLTAATNYDWLFAIYYDGNYPFPRDVERIYPVGTIPPDFYRDITYLVRAQDGEPVAGPTVNTFVNNNNDNQFYVTAMGANPVRNPSGGDPAEAVQDFGSLLNPYATISALANDHAQSGMSNITVNIATNNETIDIGNPNAATYGYYMVGWRFKGWKNNTVVQTVTATGLTIQNQNDITFEDLLFMQRVELGTEGGEISCQYAALTFKNCTFNQSAEFAFALSTMFPGEIVLKFINCTFKQTVKVSCVGTSGGRNLKCTFDHCTFNDAFRPSLTLGNENTVQAVSDFSQFTLIGCHNAGFKAVSNVIVFAYGGNTFCGSLSDNAAAIYATNYVTLVILDGLCINAGVNQGIAGIFIDTNVSYYLGKLTYCKDGTVIASRNLLDARMKNAGLESCQVRNAQPVLWSDDGFTHPLNSEISFQNIFDSEGNTIEDRALLENAVLKTSSPNRHLSSIVNIDVYNQKVNPKMQGWDFNAMQIGSRYPTGDVWFDGTPVWRERVHIEWPAGDGAVVDIPAWASEYSVPFNLVGTQSIQILKTLGTMNLTDTIKAATVPGTIEENQGIYHLQMITAELQTGDPSLVVLAITNCCDHTITIKPFSTDIIVDYVAYN